MNAAAKAIAQTRRVLARQRDALLKGQIDQLEKIANALQHAFDTLVSSDPDPRDLVALRAEAGQNARLLVAARDGLVAARGLLDRSTAPPLSTYDQTGQRALASRPEGRVLTRR